MVFVLRLSVLAWWSLVPSLQTGLGEGKCPGDIRRILSLLRLGVYLLVGPSRPQRNDCRGEQEHLAPVLIPTEGLIGCRTANWGQGTIVLPGLVFPIIWCLYTHKLWFGVRSRGWRLAVFWVTVVTTQTCIMFSFSSLQITLCYL